MIRKLCYVFALSCILQLPVRVLAQPIHVVSAPGDVLNFTETAKITRVTLTPSDVRFEFDKSTSWPEAHVPGWGDKNFTDEQKAGCVLPGGADPGCVQFTLWPVISVNGEWFTTGALEFWKGKANVGGPFSEAGKNWYDKMPPMAGVQPRSGQRVGLMVVAGDQRLKDIRSVRERSSIAWFDVPPNDTGDFTFQAPPTDPSGVVPVDPPQPGPQGPQGPKGDKGDPADPTQVQDLYNLVHDLQAQLDALKNNAPKIPTGCKAGGSLFGIKVSIHCEVTF